MPWAEKITDWTLWDNREYFTHREASTLLCGYPTWSNRSDVFQMNELINEKLGKYRCDLPDHKGKHEGNSPFTGGFINPSEVKGECRLSRETLLAFAKTIKMRPPFLFPKERIGPPNPFFNPELRAASTEKDMEVGADPDAIVPTTEPEPKRSQIKTQSRFEGKMREKIKSELEAGMKDGRRPKADAILLALDPIIGNNSITGRRTSDKNYRRWITQEAEKLGMKSNRGAKPKKKKARYLKK